MTRAQDTDAALAAERAEAQANFAELITARAEIVSLIQDAATVKANLSAQVADLQARIKPIGSSQGNYFGHTPELLRVYLQAGEKPVSYRDVPELADALDHGIPVVFSKKVLDPAWLDSFLATWPRNTASLRSRIVGYIHEPEDDLTPDAYLTGVAADAAVIRKHGLIPVQCLMNARDGRWADYASPDVDEMWWDPYQGGPGNVPKRYNSPSLFLGPLIEASASKGKPWGLGEVGSLPTAADTDQTGRFNWMTDLREYILAHPDSRGACWFNHAGNTMTQPMADAWYAGNRPT